MLAKYIVGFINIEIMLWSSPTISDVASSIQNHTKTMFTEDRLKT